jgi:ferredoxin--NADP+ reductase
MTADNATLVERIELDATLVIFRIRPDVVPPAGTPWFTSGQYVSIGIGDVQRAYSIASAPAERRFVEFYIRFAREPATEEPLTHLLWKLPIGARLHLGEKIVGRFTLERTIAADDPRTRLLVAAGTGVAPFVSMVRHARSQNDAAALLHLAVLHGASHPHELAYADELADAAQRFGLRYLPTVSRPDGHPEWTGLTGRVESLFDDGKLPGVHLSPDAAVVYVCGFQNTIAGSVRRLLSKGFMPEERRLRRVLGIPDDRKPSLFWEQYDPEPIFDLADTALIESLKASIR